MQPVKIIIMNEGFFWVIPNDLFEQFSKDEAKLNYTEFRARYRKYEVEGDLNEIQFYAEI